MGLLEVLQQRLQGVWGHRETHGGGELFPNLFAPVLSIHHRHEVQGDIRQGEHDVGQAAEVAHDKPFALPLGTANDLERP